MYLKKFTCSPLIYGQQVETLVSHILMLYKFYYHIYFTLFSVLLQREIRESCI